MNFRDVLATLGMYPRPIQLGAEMVGVVVEISPDVRGLVLGDRVMGSCEGAFGPVVVTDGRNLSRVPEGWSFVEAASASICYLTAYRGLLDIGGLGRGQTVLVHAAAGGVGMAAVQIARRAGAEVYATASRGKWDMLRAIGLDDKHIADSRTRDFEQRFRAATGGRGVDVVLNSLAGDLIDASLRLLAPGGRFVELGKTDVREPERVRACRASDT